MTARDDRPAIRPAFRVLGWILGPVVLATSLFLAVGCLTGVPAGPRAHGDCGVLSISMHFLVGVALTYAAATGRDPFVWMRGKGSRWPREPDPRA
jgi:hypothetical protein